MSFRDEGDAQRHRIEALERSLEEAHAENERVRQERDRAIAERERAERGDDGERGSGAFARGAAVLVEWNGRWWDAHVIEVIGAKLWKIHYDGWSDRWDETVGATRILPRTATPPGPRGGKPVPLQPFVAIVGLVAIGIGVWWGLSPSEPPAPTSGAPPGTVVGADELRPERPIFIESGGVWYPGWVIERVNDGAVRVHYAGYEASSDEIVTIDRVRLQ